MVQAIPTYIDYRCLAAQRDRVAAQFSREMTAYAARVEFLRDRPTDSEMAAWLDYDTRFIKMEAMKHYGLCNRDIVAHLILTEAAVGCWRARVPGGPARYSEYVVQLFLLTDTGVRQLVVDLDFVNAVLGKQDRLNFRYDAIAAAAVREVGVRFAGGKRKVFALDGSGERQHEGRPDALVLSQSFRLTLVSGTSSDVLIENYRLWASEGHGAEDQDRLWELAMETSGVSTALRVLEAVAADGRDWIQHERNRYLRSLRTYFEKETIHADTIDGFGRAWLTLEGAHTRVDE